MNLQIPVIVDDVKHLPHRANPDDAGADLHAASSLTVPAGGRTLVPTGVRAAVPHGYALFIHPRSGLALKHGITVLNAPGTIDAGFRGEIGVILFNTTDQGFTVNAGDRIAQAIVQKVELAEFLPVPALPVSERGTGGFGSTGA